MKYKVYFDVFLCDRFTSNFMRNCQLCDDVGIRTTVEITVTETPTKEYIAKIIKILESTREEQSLKQYYTGVKHLRTEVINV